MNTLLTKPSCLKIPGSTWSSLDDFFLFLSMSLAHEPQMIQPGQHSPSTCSRYRSSEPTLRNTPCFGANAQQLFLPVSNIISDHAENNENICQPTYHTFSHFFTSQYAGTTGTARRWQKMAELYDLKTTSSMHR